MKKRNISLQKKFLRVHPFLDKTVVEGSKTQISLASSTFQGRYFQLKFGAQAFNKINYKTAQQISPILSKMGQMNFASNLLTLAL